MKEMMKVAGALIEAESYQRAYTTIRKAQSYSGYEHDSYLLKLLLWCGKEAEGKKVALRGAWRRWVLQGHVDCVFDADFSPDGRYVLSASGDEQIKLYTGMSEKALLLWDVETGKCLKPLRGHRDAVSCLAFSSGGRYALSGSLGLYDENNLKLWDVKTGKCIRLFEGHPQDGIFSISFSPDGLYAVSVGMLHGQLKLWEMETGRCIRIFNEQTAGLGSLGEARFSPDGSFILFGSGKEFKLLELKTGQCIKTYKGHTDKVNSVAFSSVFSNGRYALSGSDDQTVKLWDVKSGSCVQTYKGHIGGVKSVAFSSDDSYVLSGSNDKTLKLWDQKTGKCSWTFEGHLEGIKSVSFSPDDRYVLSASSDKTLCIWEIDWEWEISDRCREDI